MTPIPLTIVFSEPVTGFQETDVQLANASIESFFGEGSVYVIALMPNGIGTVSANIHRDVANDLAGNGNDAAQQFTRFYDNQNPTVALTSSSPNPTNNSPVVVAAQFSESVEGVHESDIICTNGRASNVEGSGTDYTFDLLPLDQGVVTARIASGAALDLAGNSSNASAQFSRTFDSVGPHVTSIVCNTDSPTSVTLIEFSVAFSEPVFGVSESDFRVESSGGLTDAEIKGIDSRNGNHIVTVETKLGNGVLGIDLLDKDSVVDAASNPLGGPGSGNGDYSEGEICVIDRSPPSTFVVSPNGDYISDSPVIDLYFIAEDLISNVRHVRLFYRKDGEGEFSEYSGMFISVPIGFDTSNLGGFGTYEVYTIGTDAAGNVEPAPTAPDVVIRFQNRTRAAGWNHYK